MNRRAWPIGMSDAIWLGQLALLNLVMTQLGASNVNHLAHLGGALGGAATVALLARRMGR